MKRTPKKNSWHELAEEKCPKCKSTLMRNMFGEEYTGCSCGFYVDDDVKNALVERDYPTNKDNDGSRIQDDQTDGRDR